MRRHIVISWHRFYDPSTGRYISADPIGLAGGINLYAYVGNDPVNFIDPWGLIAGVDIYRSNSDPGCQVNQGHEWIEYNNGDDSVGYWPNKGHVVERPDSKESERYMTDHWPTEKKEVGSLKWGSGKGKECQCATDEEINSCLKARPDPDWVHLSLVNNCRRYARTSLSGCCLKKGDKEYLE